MSQKGSTTPKVVALRRAAIIPPIKLLVQNDMMGSPFGWLWEIEGKDTRKD
jgi:hypothetical protein